MIRTRLAMVVLAPSLLAPAVAAQPTTGYRVPPSPIPKFLDAPLTPTAVLSPAGDRLVLLHPRAMHACPCTHAPSS